MDKGKIILLNGVSSSGKSTLGLALQDVLPEKYFLFSQDGFSESWPYKYWKNDHDGIYIETMEYMNKTVQMLAKSGVNIIIDHLFLDNKKENATGPIVLKNCIEHFYDFQVFFVCVKCDIEELDRRERWRGNREVGTAERQLKELYPKDNYDLIICTSTFSTIDCAIKIANSMTKENCNSFKTMKSRIENGYTIE